jgi:hypothetical protein
MRFEPDQSINRVFRGKAARDLLFVLIDAPHKVVRYPDVERAVLAAGEEIDGI